MNFFVNTAYAATTPNATNLAEAIGKLTSFANTTLIPFIIGLAVIFFLFGVFKYVTAGGDEGQLKEARDFILYGIVFIAVMISVWGLVGIVVNTFFSGGTFIPQINPNPRP